MRQALEDDFKKLAERFGAPPERRHFVLGLDRLFGSTTEHVLYQVPCNILVV